VKKTIVALSLSIVLAQSVLAQIVYTEPTNLPPVASEGVMCSTNGVVTWPPNFKTTNDLASAIILSNLFSQVISNYDAFTVYTGVASTTLVLQAHFDASNAAALARLNVVETNVLTLIRFPITNEWTNAAMTLMSLDGTNLYWVAP